MNKVTVAVFLLLFFVSGALWAQSDRATITGTVLDSTSAVIPGVEVVATNAGTGIKTSSVTDTHGLYRIVNLPAGKYSVSFTKEGFKSVNRPGIILAVSQVAQVNETLGVGAAMETVVVTDDAPLLQTQTADVGTNMKANVVSELPLNAGGGRQIESFAFSITPGFQGNGYEAIVVGTQSFTKEVLIDGTSATAQIQGDVMESGPSMDAVEEVQASSSGLSAETARTNGGLVMFNLKSGTNKFHGSAFGFGHNEMFDANSWVNKAYQAHYTALGNASEAAKYNRPKSRFWDYGFSAGGPIFKNKTFIFGAYERFQQKDLRMAGFGSTVPTASFLSGDFSALLGAPLTDADGNAYINPCDNQPVLSGQIFDPRTTRVVKGQTCRDPFPGNKIPGDRISSVSQKIADVYRKGYAPQNNNLTNNARLPLNNSPLQTPIQVSIKFDHNFTDNNRLSASWIYNHRPRSLADTGGLWSAGTEDGGVLANTRLQRVIANSYRLSDSHTISPRVLNVVSVTYNEYLNSNVPAASGQDWPTYLGLGTTGAPNFPQISFGDAVNGIGTTGIGNQWQDAYVGTSTVIGDTLTWVRGRHALKFGGEFRAQLINSRATAGTMQFNFSPQQTGIIGTGYSTEVGFGFASFLLGEVNNASEATPLAMYGRRKSFSFFGQDDIKVNDRLTVNLGLRWGMTLPLHEKNGNWANFNLTAVNPTWGIPGAVEFAKDGSDSFEKNLDWKEFGPHIGAAYQLSNKIVLRGSYGIYYVPLGMDYWGGIPYTKSPFERVFTGSNIMNPPSNPWDSSFNWKNGYPGVYVPGTKDPNNIPWGPVSIDPDSLNLGYSHQFNFGLQYELARDLIVDASYVGNLGRRLHDGTLAYNQPDPKTFLNLAKLGAGNYYDWIWDEGTAAAHGVRYPYPGFVGMAFQAVAPYPQATLNYSPIYYVGTPGGQSDYSSMQIEVKKRTSRGLSGNFSYTLSRSRGNSISNFGENWWSGGIQDYTDLAKDAQTLTVWDQKHVLKGYLSYDLPFGKGRTFLSSSNKVLNGVVGGWTLGTVLRYATGRPLSVYAKNEYWFGWSAVYPDIKKGDFSSQFQNQGSVDLFYRDANGKPAAGNLYFDPTLFSNPPAWGADARLGTGRVRNDALRGFGEAYEDLSLLKHFDIGQDGKYKLSFRFEMYNVFNRHYFNNPNTDISSPEFGYVTGTTGTPRQAQFGARFEW